MVVHKCDNPDVSITQLLTVVRECKKNKENNQHNQRAEYAKVYPASTSRLTYGTKRAGGHNSTPAPAQGRYQHQDKNVPIHAAHVKPMADIQQGDYPPQYQDYDDLPERDEYEFYAAAMEMADKVEHHHNHCFNCREVGHIWQNCPKPFKDDFK